MTTSALLPVYDRDIVLVKGKGSKLWDSEGREWLDFAAGIAVNGFGYGDRRIVAAIKKAGGPNLDKRTVHLPKAHIKSVGKHAVEVRLHPSVNATVSVDVVSE